MNVVGNLRMMELIYMHVVELKVQYAYCTAMIERNWTWAEWMWLVADAHQLVPTCLLGDDLDVIGNLRMMELAQGLELASLKGNKTKLSLVQWPERSKSTSRWWRSSWGTSSLPRWQDDFGAALLPSPCFGGELNEAKGEISVALMRKKRCYVPIITILLFLCMSLNLRHNARLSV
jgi:hypothetical protein